MYSTGGGQRVEVAAVFRGGDCGTRLWIFVSQAEDCADWDAFSTHD